MRAVLLVAILSSSVSACGGRATPPAASTPAPGADGKPAGRPFDRQQAEVELMEAANNAHGQCPQQGVAGVRGKIEVTFSPPGPVTGVKLPDAWKDSEIASCIEAIFVQLQVQPFDGAAVTLSQGVDVP